jgi:hypothetical protein
VQDGFALDTVRTEVMAKNKEEYENGISLLGEYDYLALVGSREGHTKNLPSEDS